MRSREVAPVVTTGAVSSITLIVCSKFVLVFPQPSVKFQVRTRTYALAQVPSGVITSETRCIAGPAVQLSVAAGASARAADIPAASLH